jgi:hypothetical protein
VVPQTQALLVQKVLVALAVVVMVQGVPLQLPLPLGLPILVGVAGVEILQLQMEPLVVQELLFLKLWGKNGT